VQGDLTRSLRQLAHSDRPQNRGRRVTAAGTPWCGLESY
jgi:hypothetical protein